MARRRYQSRVRHLAESLPGSRISWPGRIYRIPWRGLFHRITNLGPLQDVSEVFGAARTALQRRWHAVVVLSAVAALPFVLRVFLTNVPALPTFMPLAPLFAISGVHRLIGAIEIWYYSDLIKRTGFLPTFAIGWTVPAGLLDVLCAVVLSLVGAALVLVIARADGEGDTIRALQAPLPHFRTVAYAAMLSGFLTLVVAGGMGGLEYVFAARFGASGIDTLNWLLVGALAPLFLVFQLTFAFAVLENADAVIALKLAWRRALGSHLRRNWVLAVAIMVTYGVPIGALDMVIDHLPHALLVDTWLWWRLVNLLENVVLFTFLTAVIVVVAKDYKVRAERADREAALDAPLTA